MKKLFLSIVAVFALSLCFVACGGSKITVTFDGNGGVTKDGETQVVKQIDVNGSYVVPQFYREGYTQIGWDSDIKTLTKNTVVKAQWKINTYKVTFDLNGGSLVSGGLEQTVEWNKSATAPEVEKTGYTFDGWDTSFENVTDNVTVKAKWKINTYKVTFDLNDGSLSSGDLEQTVEWNKSATAPKVEKTGYTFDDWDASFENVTDNVTVKAKWKINTYKVIFDLNGGTLDDENFDGILVDGTTDKYVITVNYGTQVTYPTIKHNNDMVQSSWEVVSGNMNGVTSDTEVKAIWTGTDGEDEHTVTFVLGKENVTYTGELKQTIKMFEGATAPVVENLQYYKFMGWDMSFDNIVGDRTVNAQWQEIKHTITFEPYGGTLTNGSLKQETTEGKVELPTVTKGDYYEFLGWCVGEKKVDKNTLYTEDTTVTAQWKEIKYTITFDAYGGTLTSGSSSQQTTEGKVELPTVTKGEYYEFLGWYDGETKVDDNTLYTRNTTLKAKWVKVKKITLKFVDTIYNNKCNDIIVKSNAKIGELPVLKDSTDEYSFKGWYYLDGEKKITVTSETILQVDETELTLYANWSSNWTGFY